MNIEDTSMKASFMAFIPTLGIRYQHVLPRRVCEESMISSATRRAA